MSICRPRQPRVLFVQVALCQECGWRRIQRPDYLCRWVDLKEHFRTKYKRAGSLKTCVEQAGQAVTHPGLLNILQLLLAVLCVPQ
jgi:hypothetical protein